MAPSGSRDADHVASSVGEYIDNFDGLTRERLDEMRDIVVKTVPDAVEGISYAIPGYRVNGKYFAYFAGWDKFVSLYPITNLPESLNDEIAPFRAGKGTARFPHTEPLPRHLIERIVRHLADARS